MIGNDSLVTVLVNFLPSVMKLVQTMHLSFLIYLITCKRCTKQYIGKTTTSLYTRFNNTRSDTKIYTTERGKSLPIAHHFNLPDHTINDAQLMAIEKIHNHREQTILYRESFWINKLRTRTPNGINVDS